MRRAIAIGLGLAMALAAAGRIGWHIVAGRWRAADLARVEREVELGRFDAARLLLMRLTTVGQGATDAQVAFLTGICEAGTGHADEALAAWSRVPSDSPYWGRAGVLAARELLKQHRLSRAEPMLARALHDQGRHSIEARRTLVGLLKVQGRLIEVSRLLREGWSRSPDRAAVLRELWNLERIAFPIEGTRAALDRAERAAPDDPGVRLGRLNLAIHEGRLDDAEALLVACHRFTASAPAVWRAHLDWARAADRPSEARVALRRLPSELLGPAEVPALAAWFASVRNETEAECLAWEQVVALDPAWPGALDRLAELATLRGDAEAAASFRARDTAMEDARSSYEAVLFGSEPATRALEMSRLAEAMGMSFEARAWAILAVWRDPADPEARDRARRLGRPEPPRSADPVAQKALASDQAGEPSRDPSQVNPSLAVPNFTDDAEVAGLRFIFDAGRTPLRHLPETMGGGVGLLDYDDDGLLDVFVVQGGPFPPDPALVHRADRLFHNRGDGTFEDATEASGLADLARGYGHGIAVGDVDNDGDADVFVTRWRAYALYLNRGDATFEDATEGWGLGGDRDWPTSAALADLDGDGDLDLYVCHYLDFDPTHSRSCRRPNGPGNVYCSPRHFQARPDHVFRNDGGRFTDVSKEAGIIEGDPDGRGLGVLIADLDGDDRPDIWVANDMTANLLFRNLGDLRFEETGRASGVAGNADGLYKAGMGVACGDLDGDTRPDLAVGNFYAESTTIYCNLGGGQFADRSAALGVSVPTRYVLSFGLAMLDANDDGYLDLAIANGHLDDLRPTAPYEMPATLLVGGPGGRMTDVSTRAGPPWSVPRLGRGLASGDLDNDGRVDLVLIAEDGPLAFFHNQTEPRSHWLTLRLEGTASGRDAVGARVSVRAGGRDQVSWRYGGGSYLSSPDPRLHFGLGATRVIEWVEVAWPSGRVDRFEAMAVDAAYLLREGQPEAEPLAGFSR